MLSVGVVHINEQYFRKYECSKCRHVQREVDDDLGTYGSGTPAVSDLEAFAKREDMR